MHQGHIAEMNTGEGKTLTATMPVYLNALSGEGAILVTTNEYLAIRDAEEMGQVYEFLGLTIGVPCVEAVMRWIRQKSVHLSIRYRLHDQCQSRF